MTPGIRNNGNVGDQIRCKDERANERHFVSFVIMLARLLA
jgi:hypothetical protein